MLPAKIPMPLCLRVTPLVLTGFLALETGCASSGGSGDKNDPTGGATSSGIAGAHSGGAQTGGTHSSGGSNTVSTVSSGGASVNATGGANTNGTGGNSCIPASTDLPAVHATDEGNTQPCSSCHGTAIAGGFVFDASGSVPVSGVTVTIKPTNGAARTAVTGSKGMFRFSGDIPAPFEACLSKCPDTECSTVTDHQSAGDCGTCHGATVPKLHLP